MAGAAAAAASGSQMSIDESETQVRLPHTLLHAFPDNDFLLVTSPVATRIVYLTTGAAALKLEHDSISSAPRAAAAVAIGSHASTSSAKVSARYILALVSDDKTLSVYRLENDETDSDKLTETCIFSHALPKRVVKLAWEDDDDVEAKRLVIGDRHGDVRSVVISANGQCGSLSRQNGGSSSKAGEEKAATSNAKVKSALDDDDDEVGTLHVGHVSLLTDFVLSSFSSSERQKPDQYIITCDRDEHIRISRWGKRRAGYIALRYLLGSTEAVGALCTVEGQNLARLQASLQAGGSGIKQDWAAHPLLLSADGSRLRVWSLAPDSAPEAQQGCLAVFDLEAVLTQHARIDMWRERRRDRLFGKGKLEMKRNTIDLSALDDAQGRPKTMLPIITKLQVISTERSQHLLFSIDGGSALFTLPLQALFETSASIADNTFCLDLDMPIIDYTLCHDQAGYLCVWLACETRADLAGPAAAERSSLQLARWDGEAGKLVLADDAKMQPIAASSLEDRGSAILAASILVYDALNLYPKQDFEATATLESTSIDGLIKGGLANHEIPGRPASKSNHSNSEHVTRRREQAREAMMKRIEDHVVSSNQPRKKKPRQRRRKAAQSNDVAEEAV